LDKITAFEEYITELEA